MTRRPKAATVDIGLRVKEPMRARIERESKQRGVSMNAEITDRLETSFTREDSFDRFFGGPEMRQMATLWAAAFVQGAKFGAYTGHRTSLDKPLDKKEITNPKSKIYQQGALAVLQALTIGMPTDDVALLVESFKGRFMTDLVNERRRAKGEST
jgi:hypothetical protein